MKNVRIIYCLDGYDSVEIPIHSTDELVARLQEIALEAMPVIDGIFSADVVVEGFGRISVSSGKMAAVVVNYTLYKIRRVE